MRCHNTMAGYKDGEGIVMIGSTHRPCALRATHSAGLLAIADGFAIGYLSQYQPGSSLKVSA